MRPWAQPTDLSFCLYQSLGNFKGKRKSVHDFALKTDAKCPPSQHFKHLISNRRTASFISLKQKAPYSDFMFLGVSQRSENTSPLISIHAANKGIPVLSAQNQDRRGSWGRRWALPAGEFCPSFVEGRVPLEPRATHLCQLSEPLFSL